MGRYAAQLQRLLGLPEPPGGIPFGSFRPADVPAAIADLVPRRLRELEALSRDDALSPQARRFFSDHKFHTYEDFCLLAKQSRPGKKDIIGYGDSLERGDTDLPAYLRHIRERDADFGEFLEKAQPAGIARAAFDTSVYITGETNSGKSYLAETLAFLLAREENAGVWVLDPHGALARRCAEWGSNNRRQCFYFDVNLGEGQLPRFNPFDQLPDKSPATLDIVTQEQVNAFAVIAGQSAMTDNMRNLLASSVHLMLALPTGSMQELFRLMDDSRNADLVLAGQRLKNPFHRDFFAHDFPKKTFAVTKAAISTRLAGLLSSSALYGITAGSSTFSVPEAFNRPGTYIFNLGKGVLGETASTMLGRLLLAQLQAAAFKRERDGLTEQKVPTKNYVLIDECHNFVNQTTGTIVAEARKYGLSLILVQQYAGQGIEPGLFKNIMTNTPLKFTGVGTAGTYEQVAQSQQADRESFYGLKRRRFHVSQRGHLPFIAAASPLLAGAEERMAPREWAAFAAGQLDRWYRPPEAEAAAPGLIAVRGADPEEYTGPAERGAPLPSPPEGSPSAPSTAAGELLAGIRRSLGFAPPPRAPASPLPASRSAAPRSAGPPSAPVPAAAPAPPQPEDSGFEAEEEIAPGQFYARKKPKFAPP